MLGAPAPWVEIAGDLRAALTIDHVAAVVGDPPPDAPPAEVVDGRQPSAVVAPVFDAGAGPELLLTRRAWHLRSHTGEVCFPGGRAEPHDVDLAATALRELHEEVGIAPEAVRIEGELTRLTTVSSPAFIVPYVGILDGRPTTRIDAGEVDAVLHVPIAELFDPSIYRQEIWMRNGEPMEITFFELADDTLWGATARMVRDLLERLVAEVSDNG